MQIALALPRRLMQCIIAGAMVLPSISTACWSDAEQLYGVSSHLLYAVARAESGLHPGAVNLTHRTRTGTYDIGLMQINSGHLPKLARLGIAESDLFDPCTNIKVGACRGDDMDGRLIRLAVSASFAGGLLLTNGACTNLTLSEALTGAEPLAGKPSGRERLVQFRFGKDAAFGVCVEPACPVVTPKTMSASAVASAHPVVNRSLATTAIPIESSAADELLARNPVPALSDASAMPVSGAATTTGTPIRNVVVAFPFASADLTDAARATLSAATRVARQSERIVISGRTDGVGDDQVNENLAQARALSVRDFLREQVPDLAADISIDAKGRCCFVAPNETQNGRSKNRRVEIAFFPRAGTAWRPASVPQRASVGPDPARDTP